MHETRCARYERPPFYLQRILRFWSTGLLHLRTSALGKVGIGLEAALRRCSGPSLNRDPKDGVSRRLQLRVMYKESSPFIYEDAIGVILALSIKEGVAR